MAPSLSWSNPSPSQLGERSDAGRPQTIEHGTVANVHAGHVVTHLGERESDGTHAGPADTDHVHPAWV